MRADRQHLLYIASHGTSTTVHESVALPYLAIGGNKVTVWLDCDLELRVSRLRRQYDFTQHQAKLILLRKDARTADYLRQAYGVDIYSQNGFDVTLTCRERSFQIRNGWVSVSL
ncbi:cytidylate kinase family protein [Kibdelosporangium philippinense]|uniref:cytidylate kinase family protein n=1 Tax=Kibdelosporangium philippinense TaxID=211113 RepID=UPI00355690BF